MKFKNKYFLDPDLGGGFGGGEGAPDNEPVVQTEPALAGAAPAHPTLDPKAFAQEFGNVIGEHFKNQRQEPPPRQISPEEAKKLLKVWEPDDAFVQEFGNLETQKSAFIKMRDALIAQADTIAQARMYEMQQQFKQQLDPVQSLLQERAAKENVDAFNSRYSQLASPKLQPFINGLASQLNTTGAFNGKSRDECFDILAESAAEAIRETNPDFKLTRNGAGAAPKGVSANSITPQRHGSGGGGGGSGDNGTAGGVKLPNAVKFFSKIKG